MNGGASVAQPAVDATTGVAPDGELRSQLSFDTGVGTSPAAPFIVGGIFRVAPTLGEHTDFSWSARVATRGFQTGPIGVALDVGMYARAGDVASIGLVGGPILGGPLGLQLAVMGHLGSEEEKGASALLGIDLLRLTMYRESLLDWWPNPLRPDEQPATVDTARR